MVYSDIAKLTKLKVLLRLQSKPKQLYYQLVVDHIEYRVPPPSIIRLVNSFGENLFRVDDDPDWIRMLQESERLYIKDVEGKRFYVTKKSLLEVRKQLAEESDKAK